MSLRLVRHVYMLSIALIAALFIAASLHVISEAVLVIAGVSVVIGAVPLWVSLRRLSRRQCWQDVRNIIAASGEQPPKSPPSAPG